MTPDQARAARIVKAQNARTRVARQVAAVGDASTVTLAVDLVNELLVDVGAALHDAESLHLADIRRREARVA